MMGLSSLALSGVIVQCSGTFLPGAGRTQVCVCVYVWRGDVSIYVYMGVCVNEFCARIVFKGTVFD